MIIIQVFSFIRNQAAIIFTIPFLSFLLHEFSSNKETQGIVIISCRIF